MSNVKINYQKLLDKVIKQHEENGEVPSLLLHCCCAPCSSYVLKYLGEFFKITTLYYNPNIYPDDEFYKREAELKRFIKQVDCKYPVDMVSSDFNTSEFYNAVKGLENIPEGGERCFACYRLRLEYTAKIAADMGFDYFTTTLSISPYKNCAKLNEISEELAEKYHVRSLPADFKKREGYRQSVELSKKYGLYRQNYCGCVFSYRERMESEHEKINKNQLVL